MPLNWLEEIQEVSSTGLTVQAQALSLDQIDPNQQLWHPGLAPYADADSIRLQQIFETDFRPVGDRREWNAPGRYIPVITPEIEFLEMVPIETEDRLAEQEMQKLNEQAGTNEQRFRELAMVSIPARVDQLVGANYRRVEMDFIEAWTKGTITARNPTKGGTAQTFSLGFDAGRIQTAGTAWSDSGVNAYDEFLAWLEDGEAEMGQIPAVAMTRAVFRAIQADAPNPIPGISQTIRATRGQISQLIGDQLGHEFQININGATVDVFDDGGITYTRTRVWPAGYVAAIPAGGRIGTTYRAPVSRAIEMARAMPQAKIDIRGMTVYYDSLNSAKSAKIQCQANWLSLPSERNVWTINTLVSG